MDSLGVIVDKIHRDLNPEEGEARVFVAKILDSERDVSLVLSTDYDGVCDVVLQVDSVAFPEIKLIDILKFAKDNLPELWESI